MDFQELNRCGSSNQFWLPLLFLLIRAYQNIEPSRHTFASWHIRVTKQVFPMKTSGFTLNPETIEATLHRQNGIFCWRYQMNHSFFG
jgi:hypothetical protein